MRVAPKVDLSSEDRKVLEQQARGRRLPGAPGRALTYRPTGGRWTSESRNRC